MSSNDIRCRPMVQADYADIASLDGSTRRDLLPQKIQEQFLDERTRGFIAEVDGKIAGYIMYWHDSPNSQNDIMKFSVARTLAGNSASIQNALLERVIQDRPALGNWNIKFYISKKDVGTLKFFKDNHPEFKPTEGIDGTLLVYEAQREVGGTLSTYVIDSNNPLFPPSMPPNDAKAPPQDIESWHDGAERPLDFATASHFVSPSHDPAYNQNSQDNTASGQEEPNEEHDEPDTTHKPLSSKALALLGREKLTEMTGMEWEMVTMNRRGKMVTVTPDDTTDLSDIYYRLGSKVAAPRAALEALAAYFNQKPNLHAPKLDKAAQLVIPVSWVRPIHITLSEPGKLAGSFKPAATQKRYSGFEDAQTYVPSRQ